jgi:hypothetical protein
MSKLSIYCCLLALILAVTFGLPCAKADDITQVFNGFTIGSGTPEFTSTITGYLTLDTSLLPSTATPDYDRNVDPFSAFAFTLTTYDGTVINYNSLSVVQILAPYGGYGCGYISTDTPSGGIGNCTTLLEFGYNGDPNLELDMTISGGYFDQQIDTNWDDTDSPVILGRAPIRGTWTETPEPGTSVLLAVGLLSLAAFSLIRRT